MTWVGPVHGRIKNGQSTSRCNLKCTGGRIAACEYLSRFVYRILPVKHERMPAPIGNSCIFLNFTSLAASGIRAHDGVVAGLGKRIAAIHFVDFITFKAADAAATVSLGRKPLA
jgi:hypothetical protein